MSSGAKKKPFPNLRMSHASDDHGVTELLRQVAERSSLNEQERKEVSQIVKRVERKAGARKTPMGKFKQSIQNNIETTQSKIKDNIETIHQSVVQKGTTSSSTSTSASAAATVGESDDHDEDNESHKSSSSGSESTNKWGKDLLHKFSNPLTAAAPSKGGSAAGEYFKNFTLKGMHNPLKPTSTATATTHANANATTTSSNTNPSEPSETSKKIKARHQKFVKDFERSKQSGRDLFKNMSKNFENSLRNLENSLLPQQQHPAQQAQAQSMEADFDLNSPEYKMDLKGISLLKEIFPDESTENLIKMHFEHIHAGKNH